MPSTDETKTLQTLTKPAQQTNLSTMSISGEIVSSLRSLTSKFLDRSVAPYSRQHTAAVALLSTGEYIPGVRVETASFPLAMPAVINAITTAAALDRRDVVAVVQSHHISNAEQSYLSSSPLGPFLLLEDDVCVRAGVTNFPVPDRLFFPFDDDTRRRPSELLSDALSIASRAIVPESNFPVGTIMRCDEYLVPGVNVEHSFWPFTLCAERNAIGTALSYGLLPVTDIYLSCVRDENATPCGACRQVLVELAPEANMWIYRGSNTEEERSNVEDLLPGYFNGKVLLGKKSG